MQILRLTLVTAIRQLFKPIWGCVARIYAMHHIMGIVSEKVTNQLTVKMVMMLRVSLEKRFWMVCVVVLKYPANPRTENPDEKRAISCW